MSKKTTIEDAIAMLGFATTPEEKVRTQGTKKEMIGPKVVYTQSEVKKTVPAKQKRSRWEYELPDLDLDHLYSQVNSYLEDLKPKPKKIVNKNENGFGKKKRNPKEETALPPPTGLFSESLNKYVIRAYQKCRDKERDEAIMSQLLKEEVQAAQRNGEMNRDWSKHPLPNLPVERQKLSTIAIDKGFDKGQEFVPQSFNNVSGQNQGGPLRNRIMASQGIKNKGMTGAGQNATIGQNGRGGGRGQFGQQSFENMGGKANREFSYSGASKIIPEVDPNNPYDEEKLFESMKIEGTSKELEKPFYRLTEIPDPSEVRPEPILKKAMQHILAKHASGSCSVHFVIDQFRSIRLDLKIQRNHGKFAVDVYEQNCRFALKHGVVDQFNQCLLQLYLLYKEGIPGNRHEFTMYKLMYMTLNCDNFGVDRLLKQLSAEDLDTQLISSVLEYARSQQAAKRPYQRKLREGVQTNAGAPNRRCALPDGLVFGQAQSVGSPHTLQEVGNWSRSYKPSVTYEYLAEVLNFQNFEECQEFLDQVGCITNKEKMTLILKDSKNIVAESKLLQGGFN